MNVSPVHSLGFPPMLALGRPPKKAKVGGSWNVACPEPIESQRSGLLHLLLPRSAQTPFLALDYSSYHDKHRENCKEHSGLHS